MSKILKPVIEEVEYESGSLDTLQETLKISFRDENKMLLFEYPTIYIVNDKNSDGYSVYVGETTDIVRRTNQHLGEIREDWAKFSKSNTTKMFVIGHHHFNKSLTLDIENRLMLYLLSVDNVSNVQNRRGNPQNKYYTSDELDEIFTKIWSSLNKKNKYLFPAESIVRNSAIFKSSPFHKLTNEQLKAKNEIIFKITSALSKNEFGTLILVKGEAGAGKTVLMSSLIDDLLNSDDTDFLRENNAINLVVNHDDQLSVYKEIEKKLEWKSGSTLDVAMKPTQFLNALKKQDANAGIVVIDEGHLLLTAKNQAYQGGNHLKDILSKSKVVVLVYDDNQIMNKSQIWVDDSFLTLQHQARLSGNLIELNNQMRIKASESTISWIRNIIDKREITKLKEDNNYDIQIFNSPKELQDAIKLKDENRHLGISRLIATYDWEYSSQSKPVEKYKDSYKYRYKDEYKNYWCVEIDGWLCPWNRELSRDRKNSKLSWIEQPQTIDEVGSTFTVQGFDLNYAGVIIGPSVKYRDGKIKFDISASKNKGAVQNRKLENGEMKNFGEDLLKNELNVLLTRGVNGLYIYAVDEELQAALKKAIL
ncbi:DNA/RNA helicase domain-containing protein [Streptococcus mitis]|uniref:DNA/RNA helicase domain-containing protein n=1 Tax=Streptococcus mitis TaxID=28037 RepID=UPI00066C281A|nr:DNA/RNA helicase domain-containing protein [Streptococcus mitis]MDU6318087.1 DNA/RNA helicase domain-containing protein [Streptococcus mitis]